MKAIEYVKVDARDGRPASQYPTRHGPADPVSPVTITHWEDGSDGVVHYFGLVDDTASLDTPGVIREIPSEEWLAITEARKEAAMDGIDTAAGDARMRFVSPGWLVEEEYRQAFEAVREWRAAGSPMDDVPSEIQTAADYEELDIEGAATSIEQTAAAWRDMLATIRDLRLNGKRMVMESTAETLRQVEGQYLGLLAGVSGQE